MTDEVLGNRIDRGVKRGPRKQIDRKPRARDQDGSFLPIHTPEKRLEVITDAETALRHGETTDQIGKRHGIPGRTVRYWLLGDERAEQARGFMIAGELSRTLDDLREARYADSPLPLACAREEFRAWSWIAERRESRLYGQKQELTVVQADLGERIREARERVINSHVIDVTPIPDNTPPVDTTVDKA